MPSARKASSQPEYRFVNPPRLPTNATRTMLVAPGVPSGTPATIRMRWPARTKPSRNASRQARIPKRIKEIAHGSLAMENAVSAEIPRV